MLVRALLDGITSKTVPASFVVNATVPSDLGSMICGAGGDPVGVLRQILDVWRCGAGGDLIGVLRQILDIWRRDAFSSFGK